MTANRSRLTPLLALVLAGTSHAADLNVGPTQLYLTLDDAVQAAVDGDRLLLEPGTWVDPGTVIDGLQLTVEATAGPGTVTLQHAATGPLVELQNGAALTWTSVDFDGQAIGHFATVDGSTLTISESTLTAGNNNQEGGAIEAIAGATLTVIDCTISGNQALAGSAIYTDSSDLLLTGSAIEGNDANTYGTVACHDGASCVVQATSFRANTALTGSILWANGPTETRLEQSSACGSSTDRSVELQTTAATVRETFFHDNPGLSGPLVLVDGAATAAFTNNHFVGAGSSTAGSALEVRGAATLINNLIAFNAGAGAAVRVNGGSLAAEYNLFYDNQPTHADVVLAPSNLVDLDPMLGPLTPGACDLAPLLPHPLSPAVDGGDPTLFGPDGSRSDIGAHTDLVPPADADGDGFHELDDCNDVDPTVNPGAAEIPCDGIDQDCDALTLDDSDADADGVSVCAGDCDDTNANVSELFQVFFDGDGDDFGRGQLPTEVCGMPDNGALVNGDCDDTDPLTYPGAPEIPQDGKDNDCDGSLLVDNDRDGSPWSEDCDDDDPERFPNNPEVPGDKVDQDCDGFDGAAWLTGGGGAVCGCAADPEPASALWAALGLLALVRRRRDPR